MDVAKKQDSKQAPKVLQGLRSLLVEATRDFGSLHKGDTYTITENDLGWDRTQQYVKSGYVKVVEVPDDGEVRTEHGGDPVDTGTPGASEGPSGLPKD